MTTPRPSATPGRREVLGLGALGAASVLLSACTTGSKESRSAQKGSDAGGGDAGSFPRTIEHAFGTTEIPQQPAKVATVSWVNHDVCLALGVVPIGMPETSYGGNAKKSTDWFDAKLQELGEPMPTMYAETDGPNFEELAALQPDLILAVYSGITEEQYTQLSKIAPTVAYPKGTLAYGTAWQDSASVIGKALGRDQEAKDVIADVEQQLADYASGNPTLKGTTFLYGTLDPSSETPISLYTDIDNRPRLLTQLGMQQAEVVTQNATDESGYFISWSPEKADQLAADVFVTWAQDASLATTLKGDPLLSKIPAVANDTLVLQTDDQQVLSVSAASVLSLPWALEHTVPAITEATKKAAGR